MPRLELGAWQDNLLGQRLLWLRLYSTMLYPDAAEMAAREECYAFFLAMGLGMQDRLGHHDLVSADVPLLGAPGVMAALRRVLEHPRPEEEFKQRATDGTKAGDVLLLVLQLDRHYGQGSLEKAYHILTLRYRLSRTPTHDTVSSSQRTLRNAWRHYCSVAHLWGAAWFLRQAFVPQPDAQPDDLHSMAPPIPSLLAVANFLQRYGQQRHPARGRQHPLLPSDTTWSVQIATPLPEIPDLPIDRLAEVEERWLARYPLPKTRRRDPVDEFIVDEFGTASPDNPYRI